MLEMVNLSTGRDINPDFVNINGQMKIIELFGIHWHEPSEEKERMELFKNHGYQTLIIWDFELKNLKHLKRKILYFERTGNGSSFSS